MPTKKIENSQAGQTLVIIIILMVISLSIGVAISSRYIQTVNITTVSDNSTRALNVAESETEHLLALPIETLEDYAINGTCGADCHLELTNADGQITIADATVTILGNSSEPFLIELKQDETKQVNLAGYPDTDFVSVCWNEPDMSIAGMYIYGQRGNYQADSFAHNPIDSTHSDNNFDITTPAMGYMNCFNVTTKVDSAMLRMKSYYNDGVAIVVPNGGASIPTQGILLETLGTAGDAIKKVSVIISDPILPAPFDYALLQKSPISPLSN